jgi:hypothetical protein
MASTISCSPAKFSGLETSFNDKDISTSKRIGD